MSAGGAPRIIKRTVLFGVLGILNFLQIMSINQKEKWSINNGIDIRILAVWRHQARSHTRTRPVWPTFLPGYRWLGSSPVTSAPGSGAFPHGGPLLVGALGLLPPPGGAATRQPLPAACTATATSWPGGALAATKLWAAPSPGPQRPLQKPGQWPHDQWARPQPRVSKSVVKVVVIFESKIEDGPLATLITTFAHNCEALPGI